MTKLLNIQNMYYVFFNVTIQKGLHFKCRKWFTDDDMGCLCAGETVMEHLPLTQNTWFEYYLTITSLKIVKICMNVNLITDRDGIKIKREQVTQTNFQRHFENPYDVYL